MGSINQNYKEALDKYKGQILGFDNHGFAVYSDGYGCQALDTCKCCGQVIHSQLCGASFCPICAVLLDLTTKELAREYCLPSYKKQFDDLENNIEYRKYMIGIITGFKTGIQFALKNASSTLQYKVSFDF